MKLKSLLAMLLVLTMMVPLFAACTPGDPATTTESTTTGPSTTTAGSTTTGPSTTTAGSTTTGSAVTTAPNTTAGPTTTGPAVTTAPNTTVPGPVIPPTPSGLSLAPISSLADYVIVYPETASDVIVAAAESLRDAIAEATGVTLEIRSDSVAVGATVPTSTKEILLGATNRYESSGAVNMRYYDFYVAFENDRLALITPGEEALVAAIDFAKETLIAGEYLTYVVGGYLHAAQYALDSMTLLGTSIKDYAIVRDAESATLAFYLLDCIRQLTGYTLPIRTVEDPETTYEILIGDTGRAATATLPSGTDDKYIINAAGTKLALYGRGDNAAYHAVVNFVATYLDGESSTLNVVRAEAAAPEVSLFTINLPDTLGAIEVTKTEIDGGIFERFLKAKAELPDQVTVLETIKVEDYPLSACRGEVYVSPDDGDDENPGTLQRPLKTLAKAVELMQDANGGIIWLRGGNYEINQSVKLTARHSGTTTSPLFIKAYEGETPVISSFKNIKTEWFTTMDALNDPMFDRLDENVDPNEIMVVDLADYGFTLEDVTELVSTSDAYGDTYRNYRTGATPVLLIAGTEYELCRYPNAGEELLSFAYAYDSGRVTDIPGSEIYPDWVNRVNSSGGKLDLYTPVPWQISLGTRNKAQHGTQKYYESKNWERYAPILDWVDTGNIWFCGRVYSDWDMGRFNVHVGKNPDGSMVCYDGNTDMPAIISTMPSHLGARSTSSAGAGHRYYLYNAFEALDIPGEWFLDVESEGLRLYVYPPEEFWEVESFSYTASYDGSLITVNDVQNLVIDGLSFEGVGTNAIARTGNGSSLKNIVIQNCYFSNMGNYGIKLTTSGRLERIAVLNNEFRQARGGMLDIRNLTAPNLVPDHIIIQNNAFYDPHPDRAIGVCISGCRSVISNNYFQNTNIDVQGPAYEIIIEYNLMEGGSEDVGDGGTIYMYGLFTRGLHIRYNTIHAQNYSGTNVYHDGMCSGNYTYYNVLSCISGYRESQQKSVYISSGHNNVIYNNIMINRDWDRRIANLQAHGKSTSGLDRVQFQTSTGYVTRPVGDPGIYESTLFYSDAADGDLIDHPVYGTSKGYAMNNGGTDAASPTWEGLYRTAAGRFTGNENYNHFDMELWEARFPLFMAKMEGAWKVLERRRTEGTNYNRRLAVLEMNTAYDNYVAELVAAGATEEAAEVEAFRQGYGYTEDFFRQPAYNVYKNNVMLSGDADYLFDHDYDGIYGEARVDFVFSDYVSNRSAVADDGTAISGGDARYSRDLRVIETNFYEHDPAKILVEGDPADPQDADYSFVDGALEKILVRIPDFEVFQHKIP